MFQYKLLFIILLVCVKNIYGQNDSNFNFAIIPDRTGGFRTGIFQDAVQKVNQINPDFCIGIGDYVEGYTDDEIKIDKQWNEFLQISDKLAVPFYMIPGNHDYTGEAQKSYWHKNFNKDYNYFLYKNVLFLLFNTNDGDGVNISKKQLNFFLNAINTHKQVDWTFIFLHHPLWNYKDDKGFSVIEDNLKDRNYTAFAGHTHIYNYQIINGNEHITLATAGGSSDLRGKDFGEIDHITLISFKNKKPAISQLALSGILSKDFTNQRKVENVKKIDSLSNVNPIILQNKKGEKTLYFDFKNTTSKSINYNIDFFYQPYWELSRSQINVPVLPNENVLIPLELKEIKPSTKDSLFYLIKLQTENFITEKGNALSLKPKAHTIYNDTSIVFIDKKEIAIPHNPHDNLQTQYSFNNKDFYKVANEKIYIEKKGNLYLRYFDEQRNAFTVAQKIRLNKINFLSPILINSNQLKKGLKYNYYEGIFSKLPDFSKLKIVKKGVANDFDIEKIMNKENNFAIKFNGLVKIPKDDLYKISLTSDDGSKLYIHNELIIDNDGSHSTATQYGYVALRAGYHPINIEYFEDFDGQELNIKFISSDNEKEISVEYLY